MHAPDGPPHLTWVGHSTFLARLGGSCFLIDPVFSPRVGAIYPRQSPPGLAPEDLPELDFILISHNHYDHLEVPFLSRLPNVPVVTPLGNGRLIPNRGGRRIEELDWWESTDVGDLRITVVPARHWSRRSLFDTNRSLWGGFVIESGAGTIYHAGDSAEFDGFTAIGERFPFLDVAILPIGGYDPAWFMEHNHLNPEQAGKAFLNLGARTMIPMHWGTYRLTDEPLHEPPARLRAWWERRRPVDRQLRVPALGESVLLADLG